MWNGKSAGYKVIYNCWIRRQLRGINLPDGIFKFHLLKIVARKRYLITVAGEAFIVLPLAKTHFTPPNPGLCDGKLFEPHFVFVCANEIIFYITLRRFIITLGSFNFIPILKYRSVSSLGNHLSKMTITTNTNSVFYSIVANILLYLLF